jgi:hypothetical protein
MSLHKISPPISRTSLRHWVQHGDYAFAWFRQASKIGQQEHRKTCRNLLRKRKISLMRHPNVYLSGVPSTRGTDPPVAEKWSKDKRQNGMASLLPQEGYIRAWLWCCWTDSDTYVSYTVDVCVCRCMCACNTMYVGAPLCRSTECVMLMWHARSASQCVREICKNRLVCSTKTYAFIIKTVKKQHWWFACFSAGICLWCDWQTDTENHVEIALCTYTVSSLV